MRDDIQEILFDERRIEEKVRDLAGRISRDYAGKELVLICVLKGAAIFTADLMRRLTVPVTVEFVQAASYGASTTSSETITIKNDLDADIKGKHVLLVDTIIDTGETLNHLFTLFRERGPASIQAVALLDKKARRSIPVPIAYSGFEIPDAFVVGYGTDFGGKYRNLPYVAVLNPASGK